VAWISTLFVAPDVKAGIKDSFRGNYFATKKASRRYAGGPFQSLASAGVHRARRDEQRRPGFVARADTKNHGLVVLTARA
jgi:hypothetical protein